jgi:CRP/FNR family transcriptional regulator
MRHVCITQGLDQSEVETLDAAVWATRAIRQSETLIRAGDAFRNIYSVRAGSFKTVVTHQNGMAQVAGFQFPGNVIGFDGLYSNRHEVTAIALEDSIACIMPFSLLERQCIESPALQHQVHVLMSAEIVRETGLMMLLGVMTAEQRVAAFLLNIAKRMRQRGYSASCFNLRMTREEIGSYLGLTIETVSLTLSRERAKAGAGIGVCEHD